MNPNPQKSPNAENEEKILQFWREKNIFEKTLSKDAPNGEFNFFEGPPTANGRPGIHHVAARSFKDIIPRYKTMRGFSVRRKAGWDTHGLPVELQVEKVLGLKSKKEIEAYGVALFNQKCKESVWTYKDEWEKLTERMGFWLDMKNPYVTYENSYIEALWGIVKKINDRGYLYRDFRVGPWCARCGTTLSSHELNQPGAYKEIKDLSVFAKFPIVGFDKAYFLAWTTTPWTLPGNVALAVGADIDYVEARAGDEILVLAKELVKILPEGYEIIAEHKGSEMVGMKYEPMYPYMKNLVKGQDEKMEKAYQVYTADFVTTTDGTGIVHTAVMYGADDFELGTKLGLPKFHTVTEEGKFIVGTDFLEGRFVKEKNEKGEETVAIDIIKDLAGRGLLFKKEKYEHSYPHCWRCDTPLIYYARTSWYFAMSKLREQLLAANEKINWEPDHIKEGRFGEWLDGIKDWAISRDRYWGTPLPVWSTASGKNVVIGGLADLKKYAKKSKNDYFVVRHAKSKAQVADRHSEIPLHELDDLADGACDPIKDLFDQSNMGDVDIVYVSEFLRAQKTAECIVGLMNKKPQVIVDKLLNERSYSASMDGKTFDELKKNPSYTNPFNVSVEDGESEKDLLNRVHQFFTKIEEANEGKKILIVSHGGFLKTATSWSQGVNGENFDSVFHTVPQFENAKIQKFEYTQIPRDTEGCLDFHKPYIDSVELELDGEKLTRTPEVMDVWFDSGSMPMAQDHKLGEDMNFDPRPADYIAEGVDQTRGWFYTMHAIANMLHDNPTEAYKNVICMGLLMDANGQKMSKSKGNVIEPWEMFNKYGADVVRFWFYSVNQPGESKNFDEKLLDEANKKVFNILRNIISFYDMYAGESVDVDPYTSTNVLDNWILALWNKTLGTVIAGLDNYQPLEPARALRDFIGEFSTWYIRRSRDRFKSDDVNDRGFALATTKYVLQEIAKTMAPFTPFIAEEVWQKFGNSESVHLENYPVAKSFDENILITMGDVRRMVTLGLDERQKANIKVRQPLAKIAIPIGLPNEFLKIIADELNVKEVHVQPDLGDSVALQKEVTQDLRDEGDMREISRAIQEMRKNADLMPGDRVIVSLVEAEPEWFASTLGNEMMRSVGADQIGRAHV